MFQEFLLLLGDSINFPWVSIERSSSVYNCKTCYLVKKPLSVDVERNLLLLITKSQGLFAVYIHHKTQISVSGKKNWNPGASLHRQITVFPPDSYHRGKYFSRSIISF